VRTDLRIGVLNALMLQQKLVMVSVIVAHVTHKLRITVAHFMSPQMSESDCREVTSLACEEFRNLRSVTNSTRKKIKSHLKVFVQIYKWEILKYLSLLQKSLVTN
jgi:5-bromo-4-chloroindolyl phosphate hydrolysis protein